MVARLHCQDRCREMISWWLSQHCRAINWYEECWHGNKMHRAWGLWVVNPEQGARLKKKNVWSSDLPVMPRMVARLCHNTAGRGVVRWSLGDCLNRDDYTVGTLIDTKSVGMGIKGMELENSTRLWVLLDFKMCDLLISQSCPVWLLGYVIILPGEVSWDASLSVIVSLRGDYTVGTLIGTKSVGMGIKCIESI